MKRQGAFYVPSAKRSKALSVVPESKEEAELSVLRRQTTKLASDVRKLKSAREVHYHDENDVGLATPFDVTNRTALLFDPPQGDGRTDRSGDSVTPISLEIRGRIQNLHTAGVAARILIIQSKERFVPVSNSATGTSAVWELAGTSNAVSSPFFYDNREHFIVLHDETYMLGSTGASNNMLPFHIKKKIYRKVNYIAGTTGPANGQIYMVMTSTASNASGVAPVIAWHSRIKFLDS